MFFFFFLSWGGLFWTSRVICLISGLYLKNQNHLYRSNFLFVNYVHLKYSFGISGQPVLLRTMWRKRNPWCLQCSGFDICVCVWLHVFLLDMRCKIASLFSSCSFRKLTRVWGISTPSVERCRLNPATKALSPISSGNVEHGLSAVPHVEQV